MPATITNPRPCDRAVSPAAQPITHAAVEAAADVGERTQLGAYTLPSGRRLLYGQRIRGHVRLVDAPAVAGQGRSWIVETELERDGQAAMLALVADYLDQARRHRCIPAAPGAIDLFIDTLADLELDQAA